MSIIKSTRRVVTEVTLVLDARQAEWLKGVVQNPFANDPDIEEPYDRKMRQDFWDALDVNSESR